MKQKDKELLELKELVDGLLPPEPILERPYPESAGIMQQLPSSVAGAKYTYTGVLSKEMIDKFIKDLYQHQI